MRILGIDPGTNTGWAVIDNTDGVVLVISGTTKLKHKNWESHGMRFIRANNLFKDLITTYKPDVVAFEAVKRFMSSDAGLVYNGVLAQLLVQCEHNQVNFAGYPATTIKKVATGSGKASKEEMIAKAKELYKITPIDDNEADAILCAHCAMTIG